MGGIRNYLSLIKFTHTIFALPFALIGFFLGICSFWDNEWNMPFKSLALLFLLVIGCMVFARSAAMAFNRYLDARFDAKNPRTAVREIPSGILKANNVLLFTIVNCILFMACSFFINKICFYLSPVALFVILFYSYTKRFTAFCHLVLGVGLSLAPIGAYLAVTGSFDLLPVLFSVSVLCWVSGFDIIYALQDEDFDRSQQLHSIPAALGRTTALRISELLHLLSAGSVIYAGIHAGYGIFYWIGAALFCALLVYQHVLVKPNDLSKVNMAFFTLNGMASVVFSIFVIIELLTSTHHITR